MKIDDLLKIAIESEASDLHIKPGNHPILRMNGVLKPLTSFPRLSASQTKELVDQITTGSQKNILEEELDLDLAYSFPGFGRFRGNIFHQRGSMAIALRIIPLEPKSIKELLLPEVLEMVSMEQRGLVLCTGTTGSGKTTTLAAMIDYVNTHRTENIITIEDPIEYLHRDKKCTISQREVGVDVTNFTRGLRAALREDPDVILVGEMRDKDTIETSLIAAETGHLVMSTLHTLDAVETVNRVVSVFPPHSQKQIRFQLASILKSVISMRLIPQMGRKGRVPAVEVMVNTPYIQECINNREKTNLIRDAIAAGVSEYGMQTFDQSIYQLYKDEYISFEQGLRYSTSPNNFKLRVAGIQSSSDIAKEEMSKDVGKIREEEDNL